MAALLYFYIMDSIMKSGIGITISWFNFLWILFISPCIKAQDTEIFPPPTVKKSIRAVQIHQNMKVDGHLNEPAWDSVQAIGDFVQIEPRQGQPASQQTSVKITYNQLFLYVGLFARDNAGKKALRAVDFKRDFDFRQHDLINLSIDGFRDERNAMVFAVNPYGVQRDLLAFDDAFYDVDWDGLWRVRTVRSDSGWTAELAIPWQTLRYPKQQDTLQQWGFNVYRNRRATNEISALAPFPRVFSATRMNYASVLTGLQPPPPRPNIRVQPYVLFSYDRFRTAGGLTSRREPGFKPGGDIKWAINPNTVLDVTANTDFAQADVDRQVNNVTRFSVFFPERRQFFLENASLFGFNISQAYDGAGGSMRMQPFFSRTIGLDDQGRPIPIEAGGRFVYRSLQQNFGAIAMRQRAQGNDPATNFFVGRYSKNFGEQNRLGGMLTLKNRPDGTNVVGTLDGFFRLDEAQSINTFVMHSSGGQVQRPGFAGMAQYYNLTNDYKIWLTQSVVTKEFNTETGFVSRKDVIGTTPGMNWYYRGPLVPWRKVIRAFEPGILPEFYWQASTGRLIERQLWLFPLWLNFQNGGYLGYSVNSVYQRLDQNFAPLGVPIDPGQYRYFRQQIWVSSDPSKIVNVLGQLDWGTYFDGRLVTADLTLQIAPSPHFSFSGRLNQNRFSDIGALDNRSTIYLYGLETRLALNPRLQLIGFYQQNSENAARNYNLRLAWEYQPLSYIYFILNKNEFQNGLRIKQSEDHAIMKLSYLRQF